jgi:epoxyqueuosine reductase
VTPHEIRELARVCGFELAGVAEAAPLVEAAHFHAWVAAGYHGQMGYLTGRRAALREDPRTLLPAARSVISVGKLYDAAGPERAGIARFARGPDYHVTVRRGLERLAALLEERHGPFAWRACVDTAPLLERALARRAGLGWIGKNTLLINQPLGSWFVLGELLVSLELEPGAPPPDRCGSCTRCIDACPTGALVAPRVLDARRCISYLTVELRRAVERHVFGCDICQEVCPWNQKPVLRTAGAARIGTDAARACP